MMEVVFRTICVVGLGDIGLRTDAILDSGNHKMPGVDINLRAMDTVNQGHIHLVKSGLDMLVHAPTIGWLRR